MIPNFNVITEKPFFLSLNKHALNYSFERYGKTIYFQILCFNWRKVSWKGKKANDVARSSV